MKYKVFDKSQNKYVTDEYDWVITPDGKLFTLENRYSGWAELIEMPNCVAKIITDDKNGTS